MLSQLLRENSGTTIEFSYEILEHAHHESTLALLTYVDAIRKNGEVAA